jgi:hypothetical protein
MTTHIFESSDCESKLTANILGFFFVLTKKKVMIVRMLDCGGLWEREENKWVDKIKGITPNLVP